MNNAQPLISVIVPVYNAENQIGRAIESLLDQTYGNLEIILVDDGSKDKSYDQCCQYLGRDSRISLFHQENKGLSSARNLGLENAHGEFVAFCDADDRMAPDSIMQLFKCMEEDVQLCIIGAFFEYSDGRTKVWRQFEDSCYTRTDDCGKFLRYGTVWGKLFRRGMIEDNKLCFVENVCTEDCIFLWAYLSYVTKVKTSSYIGYYYKKADDSLSYSSHLRHPHWWEKNYDYLVGEYSKTVSGFGTSDSDRAAIKSFVSETIFNSLYASYRFDLCRIDRKRIFQKARKAAVDYKPVSNKYRFFKAVAVSLPFWAFDGINMVIGKIA